MRHALICVSLAITAFAVEGRSTVQAATTYPWCAYYSGRDGGGPSCGSSTFEQCMATVSGTGGYCARNRYYEEPAPRPEPKRRHKRVRE